jgi:hypothetical protein
MTEDSPNLQVGPAVGGSERWLSDKGLSTSASRRGVKKLTRAQKLHKNMPGCTKPESIAFNAAIYENPAEFWHPTGTVVVDSSVRSLTVVSTLLS